MRKQTRKITINSLAPLLLFVIFTTCILAVLLTGADVYQALGNRNRTSFEHRTIAQYLTTRLRQSDAVGMPFVGDFYECSPQSDGNTFFIHEELNDRTFYTRIYCYNGYLYELFAEADGEFNPEDGEKILEINRLHFTLEESLLKIEIEYKNAVTETLILNIHSGKEYSYEK